MEKVRARHDPKRIRYGCFLPDLTGLATVSSAPNSHARYREFDQGLRVYEFCRISPGFSGHSPKLAAFAAQNGPLDHFVRFAVAAHPDRVSERLVQTDFRAGI